MAEDSLEFNWSTRVTRAWAAGDIGALFGDSPVAPTAWGRASRRRSHGDYETALLLELLDKPPVLEEVDPRDLRATQPSVTREGVSYYLTPRYKRTGQTFADYHRVANRFPVIYQREDGEQLIISGHHRAAVALLEGKLFAARLVAGPWGPPRTENTRPLAPPQGRSPTPATAYLTPLLTAGVPPTWEHEVISDYDGDIVKEILNGQRCHLNCSWGEERTTRNVQHILVELGLTPVDAAAQARFASTGSLSGRAPTSSFPG